MPPHSEQIVSRICGALFRGSLAVDRQGARWQRKARSLQCRKRGAVSRRLEHAFDAHRFGE
ncbi:hypothetical protein BRM22_25155 [Xanthomonas oryzae pv. oryzae]|nr:hypothetical protein BRM22_25155 [Xanthomonas oryzae pv. oryzae]RBJ44574.1 hypothetical protein BRO06_23015 [Xanthomonas oryzae pv. oryzae]